MSETAKPETSLAGPLLVWLVIQLAALGIGAAGLQLSARAVRPPESMAIHVLLVVQIAASAALWPMLFRHWRLSAVVIATALPFVQAAGFLSATPQPLLIGAAAMLILWLASLAVLPNPCPLSSTVIRALLVLLSIGGAMLSYLRAEFAGGDFSTHLGPITSALAEISGISGSFHWISAGLFFILCLLARVIHLMVDRGRG